ncbi:MAG: thioesterase family protein [Chitinophagales bacterium]|jgi:acyl-CoA thioester hydrolase|nr:thioesterase family protein [Bacteroidota bacterium]MBK9557054.1 thioesterase family protein [Bacteroidota bacterium]MBL0281036.1 thioesterase family protein [Bacteroidota bacterium]MBP8250132.1 thioesterase family protein [Chitinophagales bacterium]MBP9880132.1 thioesterase family protein [Chitinophagales bacterium]
MSRIQVNFPEKHIFSTEIKVRITDLNYGGHLGNDSMLALLHEARVRYLKHFGYSEMDVEGTGIIMADVAIQFKTEAFYAERLTIAIAVGDFSRVSFDIYYKVSSGSRDVAIAKTGIVFFNYEKKKVAAVPEKFRLKMESKD